MIKILRVITRLNIGGPAIHTILLSNGLDKNRYKNILVCGNASPLEGDMLYFARGKNLEIVSVPEMGREISLKNDLKAFFTLYQIIKRERPHIIHTHTAKAGALGRAAAILSGVPVRIHTFHGHIFDGYFNPARARMFLFIERFLALFTDKVIVVSDSVKEDIVNRLKVAKESKSAVIPLGFELERFLAVENKTGNIRRPLGISDTTLLVGIIGRLVPIKNHRMFLDAARILIKKNSSINVKFIIIGDGEMRGELEAYSKALGLAGEVFFTGWVEDVAAAYADLDIVALTSLNEGTPVSLIEAMASGKAVISTDVGGVRDLILNGKNGILAKTDDADEFASKLETLLRSEGLRMELGKNAREYVKDKFTKDRLIRDMERLYDECLKNRASGP